MFHLFALRSQFPIFRLKVLDVVLIVVQKLSALLYLQIRLVQIILEDGYFVLVIPQMRFIVALYPLNLTGFRRDLSFQLLYLHTLILDHSSFDLGLTL